LLVLCVLKTDYVFDARGVVVEEYLELRKMHVTSLREGKHKAIHTVPCIERVNEGCVKKWKDFQQYVDEVFNNGLVFCFTHSQGGVWNTCADNLRQAFGKTHYIQENDQK
jgi:hypothetical protein